MKQKFLLLRAILLFMNAIALSTIAHIEQDIPLHPYNNYPSKNWLELVDDVTKEIYTHLSAPHTKPHNNVAACPLATDYVKVDAANHRAPKKKYTIIVNMAGDNDLRGFIARNVKQMADVGSTDDMNIIIHVDIKMGSNQKITRRYYIEKNRIVHVNDNDPHSQSMDSGDPNTLISLCKWGITNYPADNYVLIFWNHGSGIIDPLKGRMISAAELFTFNPIENRLELDRSIAFLEFIDRMNQQQRGICWDDTTGNYLTNEKLERGMRTIQNEFLGGGKFAIVGFDACLMQMVEVTSIMDEFAQIMVGSQEVELGPGWNYEKVLSVFEHSCPQPHQFASHIVQMYDTTYNKITNDYTLSAIDLNDIALIEANVDAVAELLVEGIRNQRNNSVKAAIRASRMRQACTHFEEPSYIDLHHFYSNLLNNLNKMMLIIPTQEAHLRNKLQHLLENGKKLIETLVFANVTGKNLRNAHGISIYFPERGIHQSYPRTQFVHRVKNWLNLISLQQTA